MWRRGPGESVRSIGAGRCRGLQGTQGEAGRKSSVSSGLRSGGSIGGGCGAAMRSRRSVGSKASMWLFRRLPQDFRDPRAYLSSR